MAEQVLNDTRGPSAVEVFEVPEERLRRWLTLLRQPDRLACPEIEALLRVHGRLPVSPAPLATGQAGAELLLEAIEKLRPSDETDRDARLPHQVMWLCFVEGAKLFQAAAQLGLSERQLSRERSRAVRLLKAELENPPHERRAAYRPEPIPRIRGFLDRPAEIRKITKRLEEERLVFIHGSPGIGKTCVVAEVAAKTASTAPVLWYRFRPDVNTSLAAVLFDISEFLRNRSIEELSEYLDGALPDVDVALATRLAIRGLAESPLLIVLDDYHFVEDDPAIGGFCEEIVQRAPGLQVAAISQHRHMGIAIGSRLEIGSLARSQTEELLTKLGVDCEPDMLRAIHRWTDGNPHLLKLAASWLKNSSSESVAESIRSLRDQVEVQSFLLSHLTNVIDPDDREILKAASIFRDRFNDDALAHVVQRSRGSVMDSSLRLVRCYAATRNREGDSAFFHASVKDFVYSRIESDRKAELHTRAAEWFEKEGDGKESRFHRRRAAEL